VHSIGLLSGFCYTQFADTYQEANGLLYADRRPKIPLQRLAAATRGRDALPSVDVEGSAHQMDPHARGAGPDHVQTVADEA
jgi:hypothetical protein